MAVYVRCGRCGFTQTAPNLLPGGLRAVCVCPQCMGLIVRDQGEMGNRDDRADPDEWGSAWL